MQDSSYLTHLGHHAFWIGFRTGLASSNPPSQTWIIGLDQSSRVPCNHTEVRKTLRNYAVRSHNAVSAQAQLALPAKDDAAISQPTVSADPNPSTFRYALRIDWQVRIGIFMVVIHDEDMRRQQYVLL